MRTIELLGYVDEQHQLRVEVPPEILPGTVRVTLEVEQEGSVAWGRAALIRWAQESDDPREDIYTLEDGLPTD